MLVFHHDTYISVLFIALFLKKTGVTEVVGFNLPTSIRPKAKFNFSLSVSDAYLEQYAALTKKSDISRMAKKVGKIWGTEPKLKNFPQARFALGKENDDTPPILELPNFLSPEECKTIRDWAKHAIENGADECDEYLNYRVNQEVDEDGASAEGGALIEEFDVEECVLSPENKGKK